MRTSQIVIHLYIVSVYQLGEIQIPLTVEKCGSVPMGLVKRDIFHKYISTVIETNS